MQRHQTNRVWLSLGLFFAALGLRLAYTESIRGSPFFHNLQTNAQRYHEWASLILDGRPPLPPYDQAPGYPYLVAIVYALFGRHIEAVAGVQAVLDAAMCVVLGIAGRQLFGARAGWIAAGLAALYGPLIYFSAEMLPATVFVALATAAVAAAGHRRWVISGCLWALALTIRSEAILAFPLVGLDAWWRGARPGLLRIAAPLGLALLLFVGMNASGASTPVLLTTGGGLNLWLGNNPDADGVSPFVTGPRAAVADAVRQQAAGDAVAADRLFRRHALRFWRDAPGRAAGLLWRKFWWTWTDRELPNTSDIDWQVSYSWLFHPPFFPLSFGMIFPLAAAGLILQPRRWRDLAPLGALVMVATGTALLFFTNARFRLIMVPVLLLLAAAAINQLPGMLRAWRDSRRRLLGSLVAMGLATMVAWSNLGGIRDYRIPEIDVNTGILEREAGHFEAAIHALTTGLAASPNDAIGWIHLALAQEQAGSAIAAARAYFDALALMPADPTLNDMTGKFLQRHGLQRSLIVAYRQSPDLQGRQAIVASVLNALPGEQPGSKKGKTLPPALLR